MADMAIEDAEIDDADLGTSLHRNTAIMAAGTATSRALGLVRTALLAAAIGVNAGAASSFDIANKLPGVLLTLLASGVLNAVLVPQVVRAMQRRGGKQTVDRIVTLGIVAMLAITALLTAAAPLFILAYTSKFTPELTALTVAFALWTIPQLFFYGVYTLFGQILNARSRFGPFMWAPAANNLVAILGLIAFLVIFGPYAVPSAGGDAYRLVGDWGPGKIALLAGVATLGIAVQALVLIIPLARIGYRWRWQWSGPKGELDGIKRVAGWALAAVLLEQVGIAFVTRVASQALSVGGGAPDVASNAALTNALMLYLLPHSLITVSIVTALFTGMSRLAAKGDIAGLRAELSRGLRTIGVFTIFATASLIVLAKLAVRVTLPSTSPVVVTSVAHVVVALAFGLGPLGAMILVKQAYLALEDARSLFWIQIPMTATLIAITFIGWKVLDVHLWVVAAGAGMAISYAVSTALRMVGLRQRLGGIDGRRVLSTHLRAIVAVLPAAGTGWLLLRIIPNSSGMSRAADVAASAGWCVVIGTAMALVYGVGLVILRVDEWRSVIAGPLRRLGFRVP
jgi:putative peptidoglycan lipid II flippase